MIQPEGPGNQRRVYSISQLNREVRSLLEASYPLVWVEGEISNLARPASGHMYFSLKDESAQIRCALFRNQLRNVSTEMREGQQVLVRARVSLYEGRGDFQLIVESAEDAGEGVLRRRFEQLKQKLKDEGLFDPEHKRSLPRLPKRIGIVTSPSGAVLHDILTTLKRRFPAIPVLVYPVPVQGEGAANEIAQVIALASARRDCDVLILARGGGSLEDLWSFNEEVVARAIFDCDIPVVCGVGHETDISIADWVADQRAPTPTAAAEMLSPDQTELLLQLGNMERRLVNLVNSHLQSRNQRVDWASRRLRRPDQKLALIHQQIRAGQSRMNRAILQMLAHSKHRLERCAITLKQQDPGKRVPVIRSRLEHLDHRLSSGMEGLFAAIKNRLHENIRALNTLSPLSTLDRGYAVVRETTSRKIVKDAADVSPGDQVEAQLAHGQLLCTINKILSSSK